MRGETMTLPTILPRDIRFAPLGTREKTSKDPICNMLFFDAPIPDEFSLYETFKELEKIVLNKALKQSGGSQTSASQLLRVMRQTFLAKCVKHRILPGSVKTSAGKAGKG